MLTSVMRLSLFAMLTRTARTLWARIVVHAERDTLGMDTLAGVTIQFDKYLAYY